MEDETVLSLCAVQLGGGPERHVTSAEVDGSHSSQCAALRGRRQIRHLLAASCQQPTGASGLRNYLTEVLWSLSPRVLRSFSRRRSLYPVSAGSSGSVGS